MTSIIHASNCKGRAILVTRNKLLANRVLDEVPGARRGVWVAGQPRRIVFPASELATVGAWVREVEEEVEDGI